ncbi:MAG: DNA repair protein RecN [Nitrospinae bacterium]|nr:DNA repair protein RecN [Nitrospinota bacterium]
MLTGLRVKDFAIVEEITVEFGPGLNVLTGETGAGKSILIEALEVALGGRAPEEVIRAGAEQAVIEAVFNAQDAGGVAMWLSEQGLEDDSGQVIIRRVVSRSGRGKAFINGSQATVTQLKALGARLMDLHGQHESQTLINPQSHLPFLDSFLKLKPELGDYRQVYDELGAARRRLSGLKENQKEIERRLDLLKFQVDEIGKAELAPGEDEALEREKKRLVNSEKLAELCALAVNALEDGDDNVTGIAQRARGAIEQIAELDDSTNSMAEEITGAIFAMVELAGNVRRYADTLETDPNRLAEVDDRLNLVHTLKKKYGDTIEEILAYLEKARAELESIEFDRSHMETLEARVKQLWGQAAEMAGSLDRKRKEGAGDFARKVEKELKDLSMPKARVKMAFDYEEEAESPCVIGSKGVKLGPTGAGKAEILFSVNPGEPEKPIVKIASGGEISRLMLALKTVMAGDQPVPVMIFDEVDAGIGGVTGDRLGEKLRKLARNCQVFCVTHLAQVARQAHGHYLVEKSVKKNRVAVAVIPLDRDGRIRDLARMAGGDGARESALKWAEEALNDVG